MSVVHSKPDSIWPTGFPVLHTCDVCGWQLDRAKERRLPSRLAPFFCYPAVGIRGRTAVYEDWCRWCSARLP